MRDIIGMALALVVLRVRGENISDGFCTDGKCFVVHVDSSSFDAAQLVCQEKGGHLMTVRSQKVADDLGGLLNGASGNFWLGLKYADNQCSNPNDGLKGFKWVTGDNRTHYVNWKSDLAVCSPLCVSVSHKDGLKWTERPCNDKIEGYLCEYDNTGYCPPLSTDAPVSYQTLYGFTAKEELKEIPQFTNGTLLPLRTRHICVEGYWLKAPWNCEVFNGGCENKCVQNGQSYACICPPGFELDNNGVTCSQQDDDPCDLAKCEHKCTTVGNAFACTCKPGFHIEGGVCVDDDECQSAPCEHECINTNGSYYCQCFPGFIKSTEDIHKCKLHCDAAKCRADCDSNQIEQCNCPDGFLLDQDLYCVDIDECEGNFCEYGCENTFGGFKCSCKDGHMPTDENKCIEDFEGSGSSTPFDIFIPTSRSPTDKPTSISAGSLLGIMVCIVVCILLLVCFAHCIMRRLSKMHHYDVDKGHNEIYDFQQVIIEKHSTQQIFPNRYIKRDT
ncbi:Thrombomodulin [Labeo rohita]|uniref:Thrombomodulin n=2 Tax=Labeo rohita TaxID=84645 RepID=A0ABQ8LNS2_LABRO|nr:thrombomodulin [Labeo rohita]KAI2652314.1 Thrombomodulin [Labeo rohita]